jgi:tetratricopeptide (TPR) repeat protein
VKVIRRELSEGEALALAEEAIRENRADENQLLLATEYYMQRQRNAEKALSYALKLIQLLTVKPKPADVSAQEWERRKTNALGYAYWTAGLLETARERFSQADRLLRSGIPFLRGRDQMLAGALYNLGYVNYRLAEAGERIRIHDAVRFTEQCIQIQSPVQDQAQKNLAAMKSEYNLK